MLVAILGTLFAVRNAVKLPPAEAMEWLRAAVPAAAFAFDGAVPAWGGPRTTPLHRILGRVGIPQQRTRHAPQAGFGLERLAQGVLGLSFHAEQDVTG